MPTLGVLVPTDPGAGPPPPPEARPIGRAALHLAAQGITTVFGDRLHAGHMSGLQPRPGGSIPVTDAPVVAVHDRFPSQVRAARYAQACAELGGRPLGNAPAITRLCRDKLACQQVLAQAGLHDCLPPVQADPTRFAQAVAAWGAAFLKPRYGALGIGVRRVLPGDPLPATLPGVVPDQPDPAVLQRAVPPPRGWAGWSVRVVCQRVPGGGWVQGEPVVRRSRTDPVVNAARGAELAPGSDVLAPATQAAVARTCARVCAAIAATPAGGLAVELGLDLVIDTDGRPWLVELNSRPRGRLEGLASQDRARFHGEHLAACGRPLLYLAWWARTAV